jgi:nucleoside-diphosphate-sugar epimerase
MSGARQMKILLTGATGFVGAGLAAALCRVTRFQVRALVRRTNIAHSGPIEWLRYSGLDDRAGINDAVKGVALVVHAAARAHILTEGERDPLAAFRRVNTEWTLQLAEQAAKSGVRRFVYLSSIKVNGEATAPGRPFSARDASAPSDPYAISKYEAESGLRELARATGMEVVIIRPPLVYGAGVKGNFLSMMRALHSGIPLPLGAVNNRRSLVALDNLLSMIERCLEHPAAANQTFLVSDGEDLSTTDLLRRTSEALGRQPRLIPIPVPILMAAAALVGKRHVAQRLCGWLQLDITDARAILGWDPPISVDDGLRAAAKHFMATYGSSQP